MKNLNILLWEKFHKYSPCIEKYISEGANTNSLNKIIKNIIK